MPKFIVLVLDGLGVGAMPDVPTTRPQDIGAHTLGHVLSAAKPHLPHLSKSGSLDYFTHHQFTPHTYQGYHLSLGKSALAHFGADSFMGHQEIAGTRPHPPVHQFVRYIRRQILSDLSTAGFSGRYNGHFITVGPHLAIADNIETDYGLNINVVGSLDRLSFARITAIGQVVRRTVRVGRVIVMGGTPLQSADFSRHFHILSRDGYTAWGIDIPGLNIYNDSYRVIHMGYGVDRTTQVTSILTYHRLPVTLIGKTADVISCPDANYFPCVHTPQILHLLLHHLRTQTTGFIFANIQETDLSGHLQDPVKFAHYLELVDSFLPKILKALGPEDIFVIMGDHGNDPTIGHSNHTREFTPLMVFSKHYPSTDLGTRATLSDVGATAAAFFHLPPPQNGTSFLTTLSNSV